MYPIVILAAGLGTRLYPITKYIPKYMYPINGKPFCDYQLEYLSSQNIDIITIAIRDTSISYQIIDHIPNLDYVKINIERYGTGNAVEMYSRRFYEKQPFFVQYGDSYLPVNYAKIQKAFVKSNKMGLLTIYENTDQKLHKNNVTYKDGKIIRYQKNDESANYLDYGISIFNKKALDKIDDSCYTDLSELHNRLIEEDQLEPYIIKSRFYEVGSIRGIQDFTKYVIRKGL